MLGDSMIGTKLPALALNGREGQYQIRVPWFPWKASMTAANAS
ncbi:hypothetical protein ACFLIM_43465 [Nonomuraea sp. M3C6]|uniref:Uncharacterized protein n=1 Tax=Nonomuraea marmarensis TaxID=3351344 RepID=A0ABW7AVC3_9ACTN